MPAALGARSVRVATAAALGIVLWYAARTAYFQAFDLFAWYDDEGYMMLSVRHLLDGHRLYDEVQVPYGPLYYGMKWVLHGLLGVPLTHDAVRLTAVVSRLGTAVLSGCTVALLARNVPLAAVTFTLVFLYQNIMVREPGHPQELAALITASIPVVAYATARARPARAVAALGLLVAALASVKLNLGVFGAAAVWAALVCSLRPTWAARVLQAASLTVIVALPWLVIGQHLDTDWARMLAALGSAWICAAAVASTSRPDGSLIPRDLLRFAIWVAGGSALAFAPFVLFGGSSPGALVRCIMGSRAIARYFTFAVPLPDWPWWAAAGGIGLALLYRWTGAPEGRLGESLVFLGKLVFGAATFWFAYHSGAGKVLSLTPFSWLVLPAAREDRETRALPRLVLVWLAAIDWLQIYPVPGSQLRFGTLSVMLCGLVCLADAVAWLGSILGRVGVPVGRLAGAGVLLGTIWFNRTLCTRSQWVFQLYTPLGLPGTDRVHIMPNQAEELQDLVTYVRSHCTLTLSDPGFSSLYFWTGQQPPTLDLVPHDLRILSDDRKDAMLATLVRSSSPCVVHYKGLGQPDERFEARIDALFVPSVTIGRYQVFTRR